MWRAKEWNNCSKPCGIGKQKRKIYCATKDGKKVSNKKCKNTKPIETSRECYGRNCGEEFYHDLIHDFFVNH